MTDSSDIGAPPLGTATPAMLRIALARGWADFRKAVGLDIFFASVYVVMGWIMAWITMATGQTYWLVLAAVSFPLLGPFAAVGFYDISRRIEQQRPVDAGAVVSVIFNQRSRQLPSICAVIVIVFLFWFFLAHMIFALFLGHSTMTNITSSIDVYLTANGLMMLAVGSVIGAVFAMLVFNITVICLPMLLDREVDFVTAMINSFQAVLNAPAAMLMWAVIVAALTFVAMIPAFLGLLVVLPVLGHATWHLYDQMKEAGAA